MQTAFELVRRAAGRSPTADAIIDVKSGASISYRELLDAVESKAAGFLTKGICVRQRVAVVLPNSIAACISILALHRAGAVPALMNPRFKPAEVVSLIRQADMSACVVNSDGPVYEELRAQLGPAFPIFVLEGSCRSDAIPFAEMDTDAVRELPRHAANPEDPAFIFYTSGTTGLPKAVVIPQRAAEPRILFMATQCGHSFGRHNRVAGLMPFFHVIGFFAVFLMTLSFNGTLFLARDFVPDDVLSMIEQHKLTSLFATPTHLDALMATYSSSHNISTLENVAFAGALMPDQLLAKVRAAISCRLVNIYGTTEAMNSLFMASPETGTHFVPGFYTETRIVKIGGSVDDEVKPGEEGELIISENDAFFTEYFGRPDITREKKSGGWYRTSDAAIKLPSGVIDVKGRIDDTIISGGENIHPQEIEDVLLSYPGVKEAAVIGLPDDRWGEMVVACIVPASSIDIEALDRHCRLSDLADFKRPRRYCTLDSLPRNATNKVIRKALILELEKRGHLGS